jgi:DNA-binding transcriptional ArsR family regulator
LYNRELKKDEGTMDMDQRQDEIEATRRYSVTRMQFEMEQSEPLLKLGRALADPMRLRILGLLADRSMYGQELAEALAVTPPTISHHLNMLKAAGLITVRRENNFHHYSLNEDGLRLMVGKLTLAHLREIGESQSQAQTQGSTGDRIVATPSEDEDRALAIAAYFKDGRLLSIPIHSRQRHFAMEKIAGEFEWGRMYDEKEVNAVLKRFHDDTAALRRELVDTKIMLREHGHYWLVRPGTLPQ